MPARDLPGLDDFLAREKLSAPTSVRHAVVVGNKLPLSVDTEPDGTDVRTLWGEIARQIYDRAALSASGSFDT